MSVRILNQRYALQPNPRSGGMSTVFRASDLLSEGRTVAVKYLDGAKLKPGFLAAIYARETQALKELTHPNIVRLLDEGQDPDTGAPYLVLEWVDNELSSLFNAGSKPDWDNFEDTVGFPILEALAHAHSRDIAHRDVKPQNVLVDRDGQLRLTDFGIAKIKRELTIGLTLNEFASRPFAPPEIDDGSYTYTRDVFGFVVLSLYILSPTPITDYKDIAPAIEALQVTPAVRDALRRATATDPATRQANASILLAELRNARGARDRAQAQGVRLPLVLGENALRNARRDLAMELDSDVQTFILRDLNGGVAVQPYVQDRGKPTERVDPDAYELLGSAMRYRMVIAKNGYQLVLDEARSVDFALLERWRKTAWQPTITFSFGRCSDADSGRALIEFLERGTDEHAAALRAAAQERRDDKLFSGWMNLLDAKREAEQQRQKPIRFKDAKLDGNHIRFTLVESCDDEELIGQPRRISGDDYRRISGEIEHIDGNTLFLALSRRVSSLSLPEAGELIFDTTASERALDRQRSALDSVRLGQAVRASLRNLLLEPNKAASPSPTEDLDFVIKDLDEAKQDAVRSALGDPDFLVVEGPPGTGKTTFIAELVLQQLRRKPDSRILITSQTHVALDNAVGRILKASPSVRIVRIARPDDGRVGPEARNCTIEKQIAAWQRQVRIDSEKFLMQFAERQGISFERVKAGVLLQRLHNEVLAIEHARRKVQEGQLQLDALGSRRGGRGGRISSVDVEAIEGEVELLRESLEIAKRRKQEVVREIRHARAISQDPERLSEATIREQIASLLPAGSVGNRVAALIRVQAEWLEAFGRGSEFNRPLIDRSNVVASTCLGLLSVRGTEEQSFDLCILDEASKATALEALVPISRSRRWILVGDPKQLAPFEDELARRRDLLEAFDLEDPALRETLFDRLIRELPSSCHKILTVQHRMVQPIGRLISSCFYDGKLISKRTECDALLMNLADRAVVWLTTSKLEDRGEAKEGSTYVNNREALTIRDFLIDLDQAARSKGVRYSVCVMSGYAGQLAAIRRLTRSDATLQKTVLDLSLCTVDAVQGRETDVSIYSVTRSNRSGNAGFLKEARRINVALSRARELLMIVGDHAFVQSLPGEHPLKTVFQYISKNSSECDHQEVIL